MARVLLLSSLVLALVLSVVVVACQTSAETPNAYFGRDGGPGALGQACRSANDCNDSTLVCVTDNAGAAVCRLVCDTTAAEPCGSAFICATIVDAGPGAGACIPGAGEGEGEGGEGEGEGEGQ